LFSKTLALLAVFSAVSRWSDDPVATLLAALWLGKIEEPIALKLVLALPPTLDGIRFQRDEAKLSSG
jgi:hypothetical protein